jgi:D-alanyl-D-alanine dipeptidase
VNRWDRSKGRPEPIRALNKILERENGEPLVPLAEFAPSLKMARPQVIPFVRRTVAQMVQRAAESLPSGMFLGLVEGWRPIERQQRIYDFMWASAREAFPHRDNASLRRTVCRFVAPTDQKAPPGHCTGAAVDVWLVDEAGEAIDVTTPFDRFHGAPTYVYGLTEAAARHRKILVDAMLGAGFSNCRDEWWHYSWGDAGWAVRMDEKACVYGLVTMDPSRYAELELLWIEEAQKRVNPFLPPV